MPRQKDSPSSSSERIRRAGVRPARRALAVSFPATIRRSISDDAESPLGSIKRRIPACGHRAEGTILLETVALVSVERRASASDPRVVGGANGILFDHTRRSATGQSTPSRSHRRHEDPLPLYRKRGADASV